MTTKESLQKQIEEKKSELASLETQLSELQKQPDIEGARKWLIDFLNENYFQSGKITVKISNEYTVYYLDGQWTFCQEKKTRRFWVYYYRVWEFLQKQFSLNDDDIQMVIKEVMLKPFNCEGYTPKKLFHQNHYWC